MCERCNHKLVCFPKIIKKKLIKTSHIFFELLSAHSPLFFNNNLFHPLTLLTQNQNYMYSTLIKLVIKLMYKHLSWTSNSVICTLKKRFKARRKNREANFLYAESVIVLIISCRCKLSNCLFWRTKSGP